MSDSQESTLWFCAVLGLKVQADVDRQEDEKRVYTTNVDTLLLPFSVRATDFHQALGMATMVMEKIKATKPGWTRWFVQVNSLGEGGVITNPDDVKVTG